MEQDRPPGVVVRMNLSGQIVVVSPHLDDAVLSLGATIAAAKAGGAKIEVLTVLAGDPSSNTPAGPWDRQAGFATEGAASRARREEDRKACALLGVEPRWLDYADEQYDRHGDEEQIWRAIVPLVSGADAVLIPGCPLDNPDHAWLSEVLLRRGLPCRRVGLYVEQPYAYTARANLPVPAVASSIQPLIHEPLEWQRLGTDRGLRKIKHLAVRAYGSQLRMLGLGFIGLGRLLRDEVRKGGEAIAWLPEGAFGVG